MSTFYIKNKDKYLPVEIKSFLPKSLDDHLVIVRVGTDDHPASISDLDATEESFSNADILKEFNNISIIITPYQIGIEPLSEEEIGDKPVCLQIKSGSDVGMLEKEIKDIYNKHNTKHKMKILPTPLTVKSYREVKEILHRASVRRERRSRAKG
jgi:hypothetical protein